MKRRGWEGLVVKDEGSCYVAGRSRSWAKVKVRREGRFVVVGIDAADGHPASLLLAARKGHRLVYVGRVEWGVTRAATDRLAERHPRRLGPACDDAERSRGVVWLEPRAIVEVTFSEVMQGRLRDPVLRALVDS